MQSIGSATAFGTFSTVATAKPGQKYDSNTFIEINFQADIDSEGSVTNTEVLHGDLSPKYLIDLKGSELHVMDEDVLQDAKNQKGSSGLIYPRGYLQTQNSGSFQSLNEVIRPKKLFTLPLSHASYPESASIVLAKPITVPSLRIKQFKDGIEVGIRGNKIEVPSRSTKTTNLGNRTIHVNKVKTASPEANSLNENLDGEATDVTLTKGKQIPEKLLNAVPRSVVKRWSETIPIDLQIQVQNAGNLTTVDSTEALEVNS